MTKKVGLIVGRFCPVHKGHQYVIERALGEMDQVVVALFDHPLCPTPAALREGWLRMLYPAIDVIRVEELEGEQGTVWKRYEEMFRERIQARVTHVFSSEDYGARIARRFRATNVVVDRARAAFPVSGTQIRTDPSKFKDFLAPLVYEQLVKGN